MPQKTRLAHYAAQAGSRQLASCRCRDASQSIKTKLCAGRSAKRQALPTRAESQEETIAVAEVGRERLLELESDREFV